MPRHSWQLGVADLRDVPICIYALIDPRSGDVRYVGRTENTKARYLQHVTPNRGSRAVQAWVRELKCANLLPTLHELHTVAPGDDADTAEYETIKAFRRRGAPLLNDFSVEVRARHRRQGSVRPSCRPATEARPARTEQRPVCHVAQPTELAPAQLPSQVRAALEMPLTDLSHPPARAVVMGLTSRQLEVLRMIVEAIDRRGFAPTVRELCALLGSTSTNGTVDHLKALARKGYVAVTPGRWRGVRVLRRPENAVLRPSTDGRVPGAAS